MLSRLNVNNLFPNLLLVPILTHQTANSNSCATVFGRDFQREGGSVKLPRRSEQERTLVGAKKLSVHDLAQQWKFVADASYNRGQDRGNSENCWIFWIGIQHEGVGADAIRIHDL